MGVSQEDFIKRSTSKWGDRWDYSKTEYKKMSEKITLICRKHGPFQQFPQAHLKGSVGCSECNGQKRITTEEFILRSKKEYGDRFDYSLVSIAPGGIHQKVSIKCKKHDEIFMINAWSFLNGSVACSQCNPFSRMSKEKLSKKILKVYPKKDYDYSKVDWSLSVKEKVFIGCSNIKHGFFQQSLDNHLAGKEGCPICKDANRLMTVEEFIDKSKNIWGEKYDYSNVAFHRDEAKLKISLDCPKHGRFKYLAHRHLNGNEGCLGCRDGFGSSRGERELSEFIQGLGLVVVNNDRNVLNGLEIDVYIPDLKIGIEFNGLYYHSEKFVEPNYHYEKFIKASQSGIKLLQVWEDDWRDRQSIMKRHLRHALKKSIESKVYARDCEVEQVSTDVARSFLEENHIQGFVGASIYLALVTEGDVVALASFKKNKGDYLLSRYATSMIVVGGHSKLVKFFEKNNDYRRLITFADLTFGDGDLYRKTGWREDGTLSPDYSYLVNGKRQHKFGYRLRRFRDDPDLFFQEELTEKDLAKLNGLERVWDAGKIRFVRDKKDS